MPQLSRERWTTRIGVILAVAGSAVGLGNFLRFPGQAAQNGGGAFMIPYFISFLLLGIPLMWIEWSMGRYGGRFGHGSGPGVFNAFWKNRIAKYLGAIGIFGPLLIFFYYTYIESWTLGYTVYGILGKYTALREQSELVEFLSNYQGLGEGGLPVATYVFFLITFAVNFGIIYFGVSRGIERVSKIAMPILAILGLVLVIRVLTLGTPNPNFPDWNVKNALGFLWNPNFKALKDPAVWLAAAGQIFFTLSVGIGVILTYSSYLRRRDDILLSGLASSSTNEFMEIVVGGSVVIVAAGAFFGPGAAEEIASGGLFNIGFISMPMIFSRMVAGQLFCVIWFLLLFIAGVTSSISIIQPSVAFLQDELKLRRGAAVFLVALVCFLMSQFAIFGLPIGMVDEMDFWGGTVMLTVFGFMEAVIFCWIFGARRGWEEMHLGAALRLPRFFKYIIFYVTPLYLGVMLAAFFVVKFWDVILMKDYPAEHRLYVLALRLFLIALFFGMCLLIRYAWKKYHPPSPPEEVRG